MENTSIAIIVQTFAPTGSPTAYDSGRPRLVRDLSRHFAQLGYRVHIFQKGREANCIRLAPQIELHTVKAPSRSWGDLIFALRTRAALREATLCCYASPEDAFPYFGKRAFAIQHGVWWDNPTWSFAKRSLAKSVQYFRNTLLCRRAAVVLCVDTNFVNYLLQLGLRQEAKRCHYIPNYAGQGFFRDITVSTLSSRFRRRHLLFIRRLEPPRGADLFVRMCSRLRDRGVQFTAELIGHGSQHDVLWQMITQLGLQSILTMRQLSLDEVPAHLEGGTLTFVPTLWSEGTSLSAVESIAMGVPVISTAVGGLANVVIPGFNGDICQADPNAFADSALRFLTDEARYARVSQNCLLMRDAFSYDRWVCELHRALEGAGLLGAGCSQLHQTTTVSCPEASGLSAVL